MRLSMDNCVHLCRIPLCMYCFEPNQHDVEIRLARNTLVAVNAQAVHFALFPKIDDLNKHPALKPFGVEAAHNVIDARCVLVFGKDAKPLDAREDEALLQRTFSWRDQGNVYLVRDGFLSWSHKLDLVNDCKTLVEWKQLWDEPDAAGIEGRPRYLGGDLASRLSAGAQSITPNDFRLRADSAGYRADPDGKDLGADVDLVGPGAPYERWKKTPEYQQWRKDTGQLNQ
jgi:hypothetical protein